MLMAVSVPHSTRYDCLLRKFVPTCQCRYQYQYQCKCQCQCKCQHEAPETSQQLQISQKQSQFCFSRLVPSSLVTGLGQFTPFTGCYTRRFNVAEWAWDDLGAWPRHEQPHSCYTWFPVGSEAKPVQFHPLRYHSRPQRRQSFVLVALEQQHHPPPTTQRGFALPPQAPYSLEEYRLQPQALRQQPRRDKSLLSAFSFLFSPRTAFAERASGGIA